MAIELIESRCGIRCSQCQFREQPGCEGCVRIARPFWGDSCPVKACCEGRELAHCGLCPDFPCDLAQQFAYDPQNGDAGLRLKQCEIWREGREVEV